MRRTRWLPWIRLAVAVAILWLAWRLLQTIGWHEVVDRALAAHCGALSLAIACLVTRGVLMSWRWARCLTRLGQSFSCRFVLAAELAAILVNHLTPTARLLGGVVRARYFAARYRTTFADAYGIVLVDQTAHQLVQAILISMALIVLSWEAGSRWLALGLTVSLVVLITAGLVWRRRSRRDIADRPLVRLLTIWMERRSGRLGPLLAGSQRVAKLFSIAFADGRLQLQLALLGIAILLTSALAQWWIFRSLAVEVDLLSTLVVVGVGVAAGVVTGSPGGIATTEAAMIASYTAIGIPELEAATGTLLFRGLHYLVVLLTGLPALLLCEWRMGARFRSTGRSAPAASPADELPDSGSPSDRVG